MPASFRKVLFDLGRRPKSEARSGRDAPCLHMTWRHMVCWKSRDMSSHVKQSLSDPVVSRGWYTTPAWSGAVAVQVLILNTECHWVSFKGRRRLSLIGGFHKWETSQNGSFIMDFFCWTGWFRGTPNLGNLQLSITANSLKKRRSVAQGSKKAVCNGRNCAATGEWTRVGPDMPTLMRSWKSTRSSLNFNILI